jgi:hypothetical protein
VEKFQWAKKGCRAALGSATGTTNELYIVALKVPWDVTICETLLPLLLAFRRISSFASEKD